MKEISGNVLIETSLSGVTVSVIKTPKGVVFIDSPLTPKDVQSWRTVAMKNNGGHNRVQVLLDEHFDRTTCSLPIKIPVIAHNSTSKSIQNRPSNFRLPPSNTGSTWELYPEIGPMQWIIPEISFTSTMNLEWDDGIARLEHHPGPSKGGIWVIISHQKIVFVGDAVLVKEPPYLENANIERWIENLELLRSTTYKDFKIISGRNGIVESGDIQEQIKLLNQIKKRLDRYATKGMDSTQTEKIVASFIDNFPTRTKKMREHFESRLRWGIQQYFNRNIRQK